MPSYDPRRTRPRPASAPDPEAAPIDALLGPEPDTADASPDASSAASSPPRGAPRPIPAPKGGGPSVLRQLAPLLAVFAAVGALVWWLTRRRGHPS